jgi:hypothetical protein
MPGNYIVLLSRQARYVTNFYLGTFFKLTVGQMGLLFCMILLCHYGPSLWLNILVALKADFIKIPQEGHHIWTGTRRAPLIWNGTRRAPHHLNWYKKSITPYELVQEGYHTIWYWIFQTTFCNSMKGLSSISCLYPIITSTSCYLPTDLVQLSLIAFIIILNPLSAIKLLHISINSFQNSLLVDV